MNIKGQGAVIPVQKSFNGFRKKFYAGASTICLNAHTTARRRVPRDTGLLAAYIELNLHSPQSMLPVKSQEDSLSRAQIKFAKTQRREWDRNKVAFMKKNAIKYIPKELKAAIYHTRPPGFSQKPEYLLTAQEKEISFAISLTTPYATFNKYKVLVSHMRAKQGLVARKSKKARKEFSRKVRTALVTPLERQMETKAEISVNKTAGDQKPYKLYILNALYYARFQEYGTRARKGNRGIKARPFMAPAHRIARNQFRKFAKDGKPVRKLEFR